MASIAAMSSARSYLVAEPETRAGTFLTMPPGFANRTHFRGKARLKKHTHSVYLVRLQRVSGRQVGFSRHGFGARPANCTGKKAEVQPIFDFLRGSLPLLSRPFHGPPNMNCSLERALCRPIISSQGWQRNELLFRERD